MVKINTANKNSLYIGVLILIWL